MSLILKKLKTTTHLDPGPEGPRRSLRRLAPLAGRWRPAPERWGGRRCARARRKVRALRPSGSREPPQPGAGRGAGGAARAGAREEGAFGNTRKGGDSRCQ